MKVDSKYENRQISKAKNCKENKVRRSNHNYQMIHLGKPQGEALRA